MRAKSKRWTMADVVAASHGPLLRGSPAQPVPAKPGTPKYRNARVKGADGQTYDSKGERDRYGELVRLEAAKVITDLKRSVSFVLAPACDLGEKRKKPALRYKADFTYREGDTLVVEDFKSDITRKQPVYRIKKHLMRTVHGILIRETQKK